MKAGQRQPRERSNDQFRYERNDAMPQMLGRLGVDPAQPRVPLPNVA